jgi:hypothetical protein
MSDKWKPPKHRVAESGESRFDLDSRMAVMYPHLTSFLVTLSYSDGSPRQGGTLTTFFQDGVLKACLKDRDSGCIAFRSARTWEELLSGLDETVADPDSEWRADRGPRRR